MRFNWTNQYSILLLCWFGWVLIYLCRSILPPLLPILAKEFNMSHAESGMLETLYLAGYILVKIPAGIMVNKLGTRKTLVIGIVGYALFTLLNFFATNLFHISLLRFLLGFFQGIHLPVANMFLSEKFGKMQGKAIGFHESGPNVGNTIALPLTIFIISIWNWRFAFLLISLPAFLLAIFMYITLEDEKYNDERNGNLQIRCNRDVKLRSFLFLLFPLALAHSIYNLRLRTLFTFIPSYLVEFRGFDFWLAGWTASLLPAAGIFAKMSSRYFSELIGDRNAIFLSILISGLMLFTLTIVYDLNLTYLVLIIIGLSLYAYSPIIYSSVTKSLPTELKSLGLGVVTMIGNIVGAFSTYLAGFLIDFQGYVSALRIISIITLFSSLIFYISMRKTN